MTIAENLSSLGVERTEEENRVTDALRGNDYPSGFIQKHTGLFALYFGLGLSATDTQNFYFSK